MIRYDKIYKETLKIYRDMYRLVFPIDPEQAAMTRKDCRMMTYRAFSDLNSCSIDETIQLCKSRSGCTHYDALTGRSLILWNDDPSDNNVPGRQRWTKAHELGHVVLGHLKVTAKESSEEDGFIHTHRREFEEEADIFASVLLCPWALFHQLHIYSPADIMNVFGLSVEASNIRWEDYKRWEFSKRHEKELQWAGHMQSVYLLRKRAGRMEHPPFRFDGVRHSGVSVWMDET